MGSLTKFRVKETRSYAIWPIRKTRSWYRAPNKALPDTKQCTHLAGNPVFSPIYTDVKYDDPRLKEQGPWYKSQKLLYKTSSGAIGKHAPRDHHMPVTNFGKDQKFSEAQIATGAYRYNGLNTALDISKVLPLDCYVKAMP